MGRHTEMQNPHYASSDLKRKEKSGLIMTMQLGALRQDINLRDLRGDK